MIGIFHGIAGERVITGDTSAAACCLALDDTSTGERMRDRIPLPDSEELERRREERFLQRIAVGSAILLVVLFVVLLFLMWITGAFA